MADVYARAISRTGVFGGIDQLSADGTVVRVDSNPTGRFTAAWQRVPYPLYEIQTRSSR